MTPGADFVDTARAAWGDPLPDWIAALAAACAASTQRQVAEQLGRSAGLVSQVLRNKYPGDMAAVEEAVRGAFMHAVVACPALGPIPPRSCEEWRRAAAEFQNTNPTRVRMYRACHRCPRFRKGPST